MDDYFFTFETSSAAERTRYDTEAALLKKWL
jgi:hypothetical protein